jgi:hypothetical protein
MVNMQSGYKYRDFDDLWRELIILKVKEIDKKTRIRILEATLYDVETDEPFWHAVKIQKLYRNEKGRWIYKDSLNIPFDAFPEFSEMINEVKKICDDIKARYG